MRVGGVAPGRQNKANLAGRARSVPVRAQETRVEPDAQRRSMPRSPSNRGQDARDTTPYGVTTNGNACRTKPISRRRDWLKVLYGKRVMEDSVSKQRLQNKANFALARWAKAGFRKVRRASPLAFSKGSQSSEMSCGAHDKGGERGRSPHEDVCMTKKWQLRGARSNSFDRGRSDGSGGPGRHAQAALGRATRGPGAYFATILSCTPRRPRNRVFPLFIAGRRLHLRFSGSAEGMKKGVVPTRPGFRHLFLRVGGSELTRNEK
jgi:hypothetical protein